MKKDEILSKSRKAGNSMDEYELETYKNSLLFGGVVVVVVCAFLFIANAIVSGIKGLENGIVSYDYPAIIFAYLAGADLAWFNKSKNKHALIGGLACGFAFICLLVAYFINL